MKVYHLPFKERFIQCIRMNQALMEAGVRLYIEPERRDVYRFLARKGFTVHMTTKLAESEAASLDYSHKDPFVRVGERRMPLLFPMEMVNRCEDLWQQKRVIDYLFVGKMERQRGAELAKWKEQLKDADSLKILIEDSHKGRKLPYSAWDARYFTLMGKTRFVLCPDGAFRWTYRFFEAILCGAIPVIQRYTDCYEGFHFHYMNDTELEYNHEQARANHKLAIERLTLAPDLIRKEIANHYLKVKP